ncbi:hypothetical protein BH18VER1_BH18VER1_23020 [soil metagenome]
MKQNISTKGRAARAIAGVISLIAGAGLIPQSVPIALLLMALGLFAIFEALRGWCALRACGIKTPL